MEINVIKYADDTIITGFLSTNDTHDYVSTVREFTEWCDEHNLHLNVSKTKELIFDFRKKSEGLEPLFLHGKEVEQVGEYKYLGTTKQTHLTGRKMLILSPKRETKDYTS